MYWMLTSGAHATPQYDVIAHAALTSPVYFYLLLRHTADAIMYWTHDVTRSADVAPLTGRSRHPSIFSYRVISIFVP